MGFNEQTRRVLARYRKHGDRTAAFPFGGDGQPKGDEGPPGSLKREIPKDHPYDPRSLKPLSKALFAASVALGHTLSAYRHFSQIKSTTVSPDGKIGGKGYILAMDQVRKKLWDASEALSAISDTLHDEINAPHWKPKLALLDENDQEDVSRFVEEAQHVLDNPGDDAEEEIETIEKENDGDDKGDKDDDGGESSSEMPQGGAAEPPSQVAEDPTQMAKEASAKGVVSRFMRGLLDEQEGGPRVDNRAPGEGTGPGGSWNPQEDATEDEWGYDDGAHDSYDYPSEWDNDMRGAAQQWAESAMPSDPDTPTDGRDFGIGYGAKGEAEERAGEWSPHADLPGVPWQAVGDNTPVVDTELNARHGLNSLPGDESEPVARADYYRGDKGNTVNGEAPEEEDLGLIDTGYVHEDLDTTRLPNGEPGLE